MIMETATLLYEKDEGLEEDELSFYLKKSQLTLK